MMEIAQAHWERVSESVDILPDGRVIVDDEHWFTVDRAGRFFEPDNEPIAVLAPDGQLVGKDNTAWGNVGIQSAALPGSVEAWLTLDPQGQVIRYDADGDRHPDGAWAGCGSALRTCTAVTHVVSILEARRRPHVGFGIGFGVGFGR